MPEILTIFHKSAVKPALNLRRPTGVWELSRESQNKTYMRHSFNYITFFIIKQYEFQPEISYQLALQGSLTVGFWTQQSCLPKNCFGFASPPSRLGAIRSAPLSSPPPAPTPTKKTAVSKRNSRLYI